MVNFFEYSEAVPTQKEFAICDDHDQQPVRIEHVGDSEHQVIVISNNRTDYFFTPIDHAIILKRADGSDDRICDAMLTTNICDCFIEIKCVRKNWISDAAEQVKATISHFNDSYPDRNMGKIAYLCNWKERNKILNYSHNELVSDFRDMDVALYISNVIKELP